MKTIAFVPIKLNNERLKNKNTLLLRGKPLCFFVFEKLLEAGLETYVYCSQEEIMNFIPKEVKFLKRNIDLDQNNTKGLEIYKRFSQQITSESYLLAHATSPFVKTKTIQIAVSALESFDSAFTALKFQTFGWFNNKPLNYESNDIPRTQDIQPIYIETSSIYAFKQEVLNNNNRIGSNPYIIEVDPIEAIDIDVLKDYQMACSLQSHLV